MPKTPPPASGASSPSHLAILFRTRLRIIKNASSGARLLGYLALGLGALALAVAAGVLTSDAIVEASNAPPDPGETPRPGGAFTEVGFWLSALAIFGFSFRIMEAIYRRQDVRLLSNWPISLSAQFWYRFASAAGEVLLAGLAVAAYMLAVWWQSGDPRALMGLALAEGGLLICLTLGFAIQLGAGRYALDTGNETIEQLNRTDAGGFAAAFYYAPAVALVTSLVLLLIMDLAVVNEAMVRGTSRMFMAASGLIGGAVVVSVGVARAMFVRHYPHLLARFYESDLVQLSSGYDYQKSVHQAKRRALEAGLSEAALPLFRKDALQYGRRYPMLRLFMIAFWGAMGIAAYMEAAPTWLLGLSPAVVLAVVLAPWYRLTRPDLQPGFGQTLPIRPRDAASGRTRAVSREAIFLVAPSLAVVLALGEFPDSAIFGGAGVVGCALLTLVCGALAGRGHAGASWWVGVASSVAMVASTWFFYGGVS